MRGLYSLKSWFSGVLNPLVLFAVQRKLSPNVFTVLGVAGGALAGFGVATLNTWLVLVGVIVRLAGANMDGAVARAAKAAMARAQTPVAKAGGATPVTERHEGIGFWVNEAGDRLADWAIFAGLVFAPIAIPLDVWVTVMVAVALPTAVSLWGVWRPGPAVGAALGPAVGAGEVARAPRINGGPFGKTERCFFAVVFVALCQFGQIDDLFAGYLLQVLIWASMVTALLRWQKIRALR